MKHLNKQHFSHEHILTPLSPDNDWEEITCNGCKEPIDEPFYGCIDCKFCLHEICADAPRSMVHPSHPAHPLALHQNPTYPSQAYGCNACGTNGKGFCFSCAHCSFDLHVVCSNLPPTFFDKREHPHELNVVYEPEKLTAKVVCNICHIVNKGKYWVYYCRACKYGAHISCLVSKYGDDEEEDEEPIYPEEVSTEEEIASPEISDNDDNDEFYSVRSRSSYSPSISSTSSSISGGRRGKQKPQKETLEDMIAQKLVLDALNAAADYVGTSYTRKTRRNNFR